MLKFKSSEGFTLVEIMIVVAIVGVIAMIAVPSYQDTVRKSSRKMANATLIEVAGRQEQYFLNNKQYASDLTLLGFPANGFYIDKEGEETAASESGSVYLVQISASTASSFTLQAVPQSGQSADTCGTLSYTNTGSRTPTTDGCWQAPQC